ncbi:MAG: hypothetical protein AABX70_05855 [Nanoarchaeota archaeon]
MVKYDVIAVLENLPMGGKFKIAIDKDQPLKGKIRIHIGDEKNPSAVIQPMENASPCHLDAILKEMKKEIKFKDNKQEAKFDLYIKEGFLSKFSEGHPIALVKIIDIEAADEKEHALNEMCILIDELSLILSFNYSLPTERLFIVMINNETNELLTEATNYWLNYKNLNTFQEGGVIYIIPKENPIVNLEKMTKVLAWEYKELTEGKKEDQLLAKCLMEHKKLLRNKPGEKGQDSLMGYWTIITILAESYNLSLREKVERLFKDHDMAKEYDDIKASWKYRGSWEHFRKIPTEFKESGFDFRALKIVTDKLLMKVFARESERIQKCLTS